MSNLEYKSILVTGAAGFIGSNFINWMVPKYPGTKFINLDKIDYCSRLSNVLVSHHKNYSFTQGNILDEYLLLKILIGEKVDAIIHFAAQSHVDNSFGNSIEFTLNNVVGTHKLLEAARIYGGIKRFIHISTDEVYGEIKIGKSQEDHTLEPTNPYAASKAAAEFIVKSYHKSFKMPTIITRGNNVYGPRQYPEKVIPKFIDLLMKGKKCTIQGIANNKRNFIYVDDTVRAVETILLKGIVGEVYNIGGSDEKTILEIARLLICRLRPEYADKWQELLEYIPDRLFNDERYSVAFDKLLALGWEREVSFEEGFEKTVQWYLDNPYHFTE